MTQLEQTSSLDQGTNEAPQKVNTEDLILFKDMKSPYLTQKVWAEIRESHPDWFQKLRPNTLRGGIGLIPTYRQQVKEIIRGMYMR
ncbi:hypothetical protein KBD33_04095 [Candidatus Gracilibacteria bacterium]|nr:hypothetical protein [Candidatus Gracilibacteria bacterium]